MRNMSFMLTKAQMLDRSKTVTRRLGWWHLNLGELVQGVEKGMGLKAGEKVQRLSIIRVIELRPEPLRAMIDNVDYGIEECKKEGFGDHLTLRWPSEFVPFFCRSHKGCRPETIVNRIVFEYVDDIVIAGLFDHNQGH